MKDLKFKIAVLMTALVFIADAKAQQVDSFSAKGAVAYALQNSQQVKNALIDIDIQRQTNREITAAALPQLSGSGNITYNPNVAVQTFPNFIAGATYGVLVAQGVKDGSGNPIVSPNDFGFVQAQFGSKYGISAGVDASQLLFDGQVFVGLQARKASIQFATATAAVTNEQIKANVYKIYYQLVVGQKQLTSIDANITRFDKLLHDTKQIYNNGFAEKLDVDKVEVQLNNLRTEKLKAKNQIEAGYAGLKFLMNVPQKNTLILTDTLSDEEIKTGLLDSAYNYSDRQEYKQLTYLKQLNNFNIRRYRLSKLPTLSVSANYSKNAQRQKPDIFKGTYFTSSFVGLRLAVPLYDGGAKNARIASAKLSLLKTVNNIEQLQQSIDNDVEQSRLNLRTAVLTMDSQKKNIELAENVYNTTKLKYEQGLGSNQEIYTAQTELKVAQNNYYSSVYDAITAKIDYLKATGKLF